MLPLVNGDLLLYGYTESSGGVENQYALCVAPNGEIIWEYVGDSPDNEFVIDAIETKEGELVLVVVVEEDGKLVKLNADGNIQWTKRYELAGWQFASQIAQPNNGEFLLAGFSMSNDARRQADIWLARCTSDGVMKLETSFGESTHDDYAQWLIRLKDGSYLIGGLSNGMLLSRIDEGGNILWMR